MAVGLGLLVASCDFPITDLARARRISGLDIPRDVKITLKDYGNGAFSETTDIVVELSAEAFALLAQEAATKGYLPVVDTIFMGERVGPDGLYFQDPPIGAPDGTVWITVFMDEKTHRILMRRSTS